jgi:hypothetical protein
MSNWLAATYPGIWGERIVPVGPQPAADVATLQASVPFSVVPSLWDTFNYTLVEAMSLGRTTLGSSGAGSSYLLEHERNGLRFAPDDPHVLAQAMVEALAMPEGRRATIGMAARETVARDLDPGLCAAASLSAFSSVGMSARLDVPGPWIRGFFDARSERVAEGHLENVSIRRLASHLKSRLTRKLVG